jgi:protein tyrosine/serine phosphatase
MHKFLLMLSILLLAFSPAFARDAKWAKPLVLAGASNLNLVAPSLYRSAQPTAEGFKNLNKAYHIVTDLNLRTGPSEVDLLKGTDIAAEHVPMTVFVTQDQVVSALKIIIAAQKKGPVLVHCQRGADRTGAVIAMYRILLQGWSKAQALDEMEHGGYAFDPLLINIPYFINHADLAVYRTALAISP